MPLECLQMLVTSSPMAKMPLFSSFGINDDHRPLPRRQCRDDGDGDGDTGNKEEKTVNDNDRGRSSSLVPPLVSGNRREKSSRGLFSEDVDGHHHHPHHHRNNNSVKDDTINGPDAEDFDHDHEQQPLRSLSRRGSVEEEDEDDDDDDDFPVPPPPPPPPRTWREKMWTIWLQSKGMVFVILSQFFGASMNIMTQVLEVDGSHGPAMHPFQILFARMSITVIASYLYMWYAKVSNPLGTQQVLGLLIMRAVTGFFGVYGLYYSVQYMALSEATVLTFLSPILSCYACSFLIPGERFSRKQQLAGVVSLLGVILIAKPFSSSSSSSSPSSGEGASPGEPNPEPVVPPHPSPTPSPPRDENGDTYHHFLAIVAALVGVLGAAGAYVAIRMIGTRTHALVSVTYFSVWSMMVSIVAMAAIPSIPFRLPGNMVEWTLLLGLGICGFILQFLLTAGLAYVPPPLPSPLASPSPSRRRTAQSSSGYGSGATFMLYTQMLFALFYDKVIWGRSLSAVSWVGSGLILGSAIYVAVAGDGSNNDDKNDNNNGPQNGRHAESYNKDDFTAEEEVEERCLEDDGTETGIGTGTDQ